MVHVKGIYIYSMCVCVCDIYDIFTVSGVMATLEFLYPLLAVVGLCCCAWAFSSCGRQGLLASFGAQAAHSGGFSLVERSKRSEHEF